MLEVSRRNNIQTFDLKNNAAVTSIYSIHLVILGTLNIIQNSSNKINRNIFAHFCIILSKEYIALEYLLNGFKI